jgi:hypothetical protein
MSASFKTSIRIPDNTPFGAVIDRHGDLMISLDGTFLEGTIVMKLTQDQWSELCHTVLEAAVNDARKKGYKI